MINGLLFGQKHLCLHIVCVNSQIIRMINGLLFGQKHLCLHIVCVNSTHVTEKVNINYFLLTEHRKHSLLTVN